MRIRRSIKPRQKHWTLFLKVLVIILISTAVWKGIHKKPAISSDIYPYLLNLPAELVLQCQKEGKEISPTAWADLIAIRSTVTKDEELYLVQQLQQDIDFEELSWQNSEFQISEEAVKQILWKRHVLLTYPFYEPGRFVFPVIGKVWYMDTFGADREGGVRKHEGTDIFGAEGIPVISIGNGKIERLGWNRLGGERVGVRGEDGNYYYYAHLNTINPHLQEGQKVKKGDFLGTLGHTGDALTTPDHLHFGIELPNGEWVNPYPFLTIWQQSQEENALSQKNSIS
ncbi:metalloendopeptidase-like membrane protein [Desulfitobacterium dehalogenans ATCC 51507]|uniref:Metalloendopeptidase-like membrane protein n=1 Tax=Desulfitobacterium dehalogenans (strain ATCC 51507 / DSM 9161 / JW/IU-DC1) TaxID=756499 RepID=I4A991_DESDJ|nr:M23 family metallopeptidase [Desulfitobacterium dehalogenans]AFM00526.1 metalloendopeptidase-like membrane protein [Desulfitobacterium dehalogenans ATCC 51507]